MTGRREPGAENSEVGSILGLQRPRPTRHPLGLRLGSQLPAPRNGPPPECRLCGAEIDLQPTGRPPKFCSSRCRYEAADLRKTLRDWIDNRPIWERMVRLRIAGAARQLRLLDANIAKMEARIAEIDGQG